MTLRLSRAANARLSLLASLVLLAAIAPRARAYFPESTAAVPTPALDPGFPVSVLGSTFTLAPEFVDLDLDGRFEVVAVDNLGTVYIVGKNGVSAGGWPRALGSPAGTAATAGCACRESSTTRVESSRPTISGAAPASGVGRTFCAGLSCSASSRAFRASARDE